MTIGNLQALQSQFLGLVSGRASELVASQLAAIERPQGETPDAPIPGVQDSPPMLAEQAPPAVRHALFRETIERHEFEGLDITVVGRGEIGDKARQLIEKTAWLRTPGFATPPRTVFAEGFFDGFFRANGLGADLRHLPAGEEAVQRICAGTFTPEEMRVLSEFSALYPGMPLAARSSAKGDARGTGTYRTEFSGSDVGSLAAGMRAVLASYFSPNAVVFRREAQTGEGFAVIVEPVIGQWLSEEADDASFGPALSGTGYTSTSRGEGYLKVVPGLGGGVESRTTEVLTRSKLLPAGGILGEYIVQELGRVLTHSSSGGSWRRSSLLRTDTPPRYCEGRFAHPFSVQVLDREGDRWHLRPGHEVVYKEELERSIDDLNMMPVFEMMREMEALRPAAVF